MSPLRSSSSFWKTVRGSLPHFLSSPRSSRPALRSSDNQGRHGMNSRPMLQEYALFRRSCEHPCLNAMAFTLQSALPVRPLARRIPAHTDSSFSSYFSRISRQGLLLRWHPHRTFGLLPTVLLWILFPEGTRPPPSLRLCTAANAFRNPSWNTSPEALSLSCETPVPCL